MKRCASSLAPQGYRFDPAICSYLIRVLASAFVTAGLCRTNTLYQFNWKVSTHREQKKFKK
ncbi:MAG TPA: hypothetical protein C5S50_04570 [Methanosarcinaceae archaeon]|nr:hypothetical protein [Methanosarcinaceae archaeon]